MAVARKGPHVVVVGAGIIGASAAFQLARGCADVTVIDAGAPAATAASFGWINASFFLNEAHHRLRAEGIAAWHRLDGDLPGGTGAIWSGSLNWEVAGLALDGEARKLNALGYACRRIDADEIGRMEPALAEVPDGALWLPDEGAVDPGDVTRRMLAAAQGLGARVWAGVRVTGLDVTGTRVRGVVTEGGTLAADHVVLAAGTATPDLLAPLGLNVPLVPRPGLTLVTRPLPPMLSRILVVPGTEIRQGADGRFLMPTAASHQGDDSETIGGPPGALADQAIRRLRTLFPDADLRWEVVRTGWRPVPADGLPVVGTHAGVDGLTVAVMHSGVTLAAIAGEAVAGSVLAGRSLPLFRPHGPERFGIAA